ncbi:hypothetical protein [Mycobacteroides abscessus]|uniref:hypothetical protein n=1 Tax=Mycobacteroides abscessus TaxID=36809 RepID=UPI002105FA5E|nr:hypothetical protein [Mycobacteroides abscessus]
MSNPESHHGPADQPDRERVRGGELDLTGVVDQPRVLERFIRRAIAEAKGGEIPPWGARVMARHLANLLSDRASALHHFAVTGRIAVEPITIELGKLLDAPHSAFTMEVIAQLGTYLLGARQRHEKRREAAYSDHLRALIAELGPAFAAFLTLPDITEADAREHFENVYYGVFANVEDIAHDVADGLEVQRRIDDAGLSDVASPDTDLLLELAARRWDIVQYQNRFYLFEK